MIGTTRLLFPMATWRALGALCAGLVLMACAHTPAPELYLLDLPAAGAGGLEQGLAVGVGPVELPRYLDRPQIVTRASDHQISVSEAHLWAEPIKDSATRVLVASIAAALDSTRVFRLPRNQRTPLDWRVQIEIERFDGVVGGMALLSARWTLFRGDAKAATTTRTALLEEPATAPGYAALVAAQTRALARLGADIAAAIEAAAP